MAVAILQAVQFVDSGSRRQWRWLRTRRPATGSSPLLRRILAEDSTNYEAAKVRSQPAACEESRPTWHQASALLVSTATPSENFLRWLARTRPCIFCAHRPSPEGEALQRRLVALRQPQQSMSVEFYHQFRSACALSRWLLAGLALRVTKQGGGEQIAATPYPGRERRLLDACPDGRQFRRLSSLWEDWRGDREVIGPLLASSFIRCRSSGKGEGRARRDETRAVSMPSVACTRRK